MAGTLNEPGTRPDPGAAATGGAPTSRNWMGVTSLITALLGMSLVAIVTGHLGLRAARRGQADNRSIARAGTIVGYVGFVLFLAAITLGFFAWIDARRYEQDDLARDDVLRVSEAVFSAWSLHPEDAIWVDMGGSESYEVSFWGSGEVVATVPKTVRESAYVSVTINPNDLSDRCVSISYYQGKKSDASVSNRAGFSNQSCSDLGYEDSRTVL
jgi:hypothetical protein